MIDSNPSGWIKEPYIFQTLLYVTAGSYNVSNISGDAVILYTRTDVLSVRWMHKYLVNYLSVFMGPYIKHKPNAGPSSMISNRKMCL